MHTHALALPAQSAQEGDSPAAGWPGQVSVFQRKWQFSSCGGELEAASAQLHQLPGRPHPPHPGLPRPMLPG